MSQKKAKTKKEVVQEERTPKKQVIETKDVSAFKMKDVHFEDKFITYLDKTTKIQGTIPATFRRLVIARTKIVCHKGEFLSKNDAACFNEAAKEFWLEEIK